MVRFIKKNDDKEYDIVSKKGVKKGDLKLFLA